jgi:hypothetical protein
MLPMWRSPPSLVQNARCGSHLAGASSRSCHSIWPGNALNQMSDFGIAWSTSGQKPTQSGHSLIGVSPERRRHETLSTPPPQQAMELLKQARTEPTPTLRPQIIGLDAITGVMHQLIRDKGVKYRWIPRATRACINPWISARLPPSLVESRLSAPGNWSEFCRVGNPKWQLPGRQF